MTTSLLDSLLAADPPIPKGKKGRKQETGLPRAPEEVTVENKPAPEVLKIEPVPLQQNFQSLSLSGPLSNLTQLKPPTPNSTSIPLQAPIPIQTPEQLQIYHQQSITQLQSKIKATPPLKMDISSLSYCLSKLSEINQTIVNGVNTVNALRNQLLSQLTEITNEITYLQGLILDHAESITQLQIYAEQLLNFRKVKLEAFLTDVVRAIFDKHVTVTIELSNKKAGFLWHDSRYPDREKIPIDTESKGGGTLQVLSAACRVFAILTNNLRRVMLYDESFNAVSKDHIPAISEFLKSLCTEHGFKILCVTHDVNLAAKSDKHYEISADGVFTPY